jgi:hypothetical protein
MRQQGIDQGAVRVAGRRVDDEAGRFVQDNEVGVFIEDGERNGLRLRPGGLGGRDVEFVGHARFDRFRGFLDTAACDCEVAGLDQRLDAGAGDGADPVRQESVYTLARLIRGRDKADGTSWNGVLRG